MDDKHFKWIIGEIRSEVILELICEPGISRPRMKPVTDFPETTRVEVSRKLREIFPLGTQFKTRVKVCQKHALDGTPLGKPYLNVNDIGVIVATIPDKGLVAKLDPTGVSGRKYYYVLE